MVDHGGHLDLAQLIGQIDHVLRHAEDLHEPAELFDARKRTPEALERGPHAEVRSEDEARAPHAEAVQFLEGGVAERIVDERDAAKVLNVPDCSERVLEE